MAKKTPQYLYGILDISFFEGRNCISETLIASRTPKLIKGVLKALESTVGIDKECSDCYCTLALSTARVARSSVIRRNTNPEWNERMRVFCAHKVTDVEVKVKDADDVGARTIGSVHFSVDDVIRGEPIEGWFTLLNKNGKVTPSKASVRLGLRFFDAEYDILFNKGINHGLYVSAIVHTFFQQRSGCRVRLYQDAHVDKSFDPDIYLFGGKRYKPPRAWEDMYADVVNARHFVYIAGWAVHDTSVMVRNADTPIVGAVNVTLGDLLIRKTNEGVRVLVMIWDDKFSNNAPFMINGVMGTRDEHTMNFFRNSKVECFLCPRDPDKSLSFFQGFQIGNMFTHHQKTMVMDAPFSDDVQDTRRRLIGYVGGLDLCGGRYDTQAHPLFTSLNKEHANDFHQKCLNNATIEKGGPRQPWHDIHSRVEGAIAWDVLHNFEKRWLKQATKLQNSFLTISKIPEIVGPCDVVPEYDPDTWCAQLLRSIDSGSVTGFPSTHEEATELGLVPGKGNVVDRSCQDAYIQAIRRARNFIYIENQYFIGSCHLWDSDQKCGCTQLIPAEIAIKILKKIELGERFCAYVVIPMFPDGLPAGQSVQSILFWQKKTVSMMYRIIARALQDNGRFNEHPTDFLSFFCLGNREVDRPGNQVPSQKPEVSSDHFYAQENRRFMIYVHSKLMIVDDEFVIVGSANINQRSMDGSRDTELAIAAFQPHHTMAATPTGTPFGDVHGFRLSLWAEHMGRIEEAFLHPWSLECMQRVNAIATRNWEMYTGPDIVDLEGHLMKYPYSVAQDGSIEAVPDTFPDIKASVSGSKTSLPDILTT